MKTIDLFIISIIKATIGTFFLSYLLIYKEQDMMPLMIDQLRYLHDIELIDSSIYNLFLSDKELWANRTFYSRVLGFAAWVIPFQQQPIVIAIYANIIFHIGIAVYTTKIFIWAGGTNVRVFFYLLALSPTFTIYSFFALRDLLITLVVMIFLYNLIKKKYIRSLFQFIFMIFLRPFFLALFLLWISFVITKNVGNRINYTKTWYLFSAIIMMFFTYIIGTYFAPESISGFAKRDFDLLRIIIGGSGLEALLGDNSGNRVSQSANIYARLIMIDSVIFPILSFSLFILAIIKSSFFNLKYKNNDFFFFSLITIVSAFFITYTYFAITDAFAFRKIMPLLPMMWITIFLWLENTKKVDKIL